MISYIGIDPGVGGGVAILRDGVAPIVEDIPTLTLGKTKKINAALLAALLSEHLDGGANLALVAIESVHAMPAQGVRSVFSFGQSFGICQGVVAGLGWPMELVTPQAWTKVMMRGRVRGKDANRQRAIELFPQLSQELSLKKHHNRADALLIAEYMRRTTSCGEQST